MSSCGSLYAMCDFHVQLYTGCCPHVYVLPSSPLCVCMCVSADCGPHISLTEEDVQKQASHCNDKKTASKRVQEMSAELFFAAFVKVNAHPVTLRAVIDSWYQALNLQLFHVRATFNLPSLCT